MSNEALETFERSIRLRYETDTIMHGAQLASLLVAPIVAFAAAAVVVLVEGTHGHESVNLLGGILAVSLSFEILLVMVILMLMHRRMIRHAVRDAEWRGGLIEFARAADADVSGLVSIDADIAMKERSMTGYPTVAITIIYAALIFVQVLFADRISAGIFTGTLLPGHLALFSIFFMGIILTLVMLAIMYRFSVRFPYRHDKRQRHFVEELRACLGKKGYNLSPMRKANVHIHMTAHIILMVVTCGIYSIFLIWFINRSFNNHITAQWRYEEDLYRVLSGRR